MNMDWKVFCVVRYIYFSDMTAKNEFNRGAEEPTYIIVMLDTRDRKISIV